MILSYRQQVLNMHFFIFVIVCYPGELQVYVWHQCFTESCDSSITTVWKNSEQHVALTKCAEHCLSQSFLIHSSRWCCCEHRLLIKQVYEDRDGPLSSLSSDIGTFVDMHSAAFPPLIYKCFNSAANLLFYLQLWSFTSLLTHSSSSLKFRLPLSSLPFLCFLPAIHPPTLLFHSSVT